MPTSSPRLSWSTAEVSVIIERWAAGDTLVRIAEMIDRSWRSVEGKVGRLIRDGILDRHHASDASDKRAAVASLHAAGYPDTEIASRTGFHLRYVKSLRYSLGLKPNPPDPAVRAAAYQKRWKKRGPLWHERRRYHEMEAFIAGWPPGCTRRMAAALEALVHGPQTAMAVAAITGRELSVARRTLHDLVRKGWVRRRGQRQILWWLVPKVRTGRLQVIAEEGGLLT